MLLSQPNNGATLLTEGLPDLQTRTVIRSFYCDGGFASPTTDEDLLPKKPICEG